MRRIFGGLLLGVPLLFILLQTVVQAAEAGPPVRLEVLDLPEERREHREVPPEVTGKRADSIRAEAARIAAHPTRAFRYGSQLTLRLENGRFAALTDIMVPVHWGSGIECCDTIFRFVAFWEDVGFHVVRADSHFSAETLLISSRTAEVAALTGTVFRDPRRPDRVVSILSDDMLGNELEVRTLQAGRWVQIQFCPHAAYGTDFVRWDTEGRILLRQLPEQMDKAFAFDTDGRLDLTGCR